MNGYIITMTTNKEKESNSKIVIIKSISKYRKVMFGLIRQNTKET